MTANVTEIADGIFRLSVFVPEIAPPQGFVFNSFLIVDDEPLLFHAGQRAMFPLFAEAVASIMQVERLRWISFGHIEADECGAMNLWLAAAPGAQIVHGRTACDISLNDLADRARTKRLKPEEVQGATFTITNPGVFGSLLGTPIIPLGTSAILGLGAIEKRPKVLTGADGEDVIAVRTCAYFSLSFDHRIVDGTDADKFLASVKKGLETFPDASR